MKLCYLSLLRLGKPLLTSIPGIISMSSLHIYAQQIREASMPEKTQTDMESRLIALRELRPNLSLRDCGELDCIVNHGLDGWNNWLKRKGVK